MHGFFSEDDEEFEEDRARPSCSVDVEWPGEEGLEDMGDGLSAEIGEEGILKVALDSLFALSDLGEPPPSWEK